MICRPCGERNHGTCRGKLVHYTYCDCQHMPDPALAALAHLRRQLHAVGILGTILPPFRLTPK